MELYLNYEVPERFCVKAGGSDVESEELELESDQVYQIAVAANTPTSSSGKSIKLFQILHSKSALGGENNL